MAHRVRVPIADLGAGTRALPSEALHYLVRVQRLGVGASFVAFDPENGLEVDGTIRQLMRDGAVCEFSEPRRAPRLGGLGVSLLQATGKGDKLQEVVRAATALGAARVEVVVTERSVARPAVERAERLRAVAISAARQSGRGDVPRIEGPSSLEDALASAHERGPELLRLCLHPLATTPLASAIEAWRPGVPAALLIGPEGGFSDLELESIEASGFKLVALGPLVLRTELAGIAALGCFAARLAGAADRL